MLKPNIGLVSFLHLQDADCAVKEAPSYKVAFIAVVTAVNLTKEENINYVKEGDKIVINQDEVSYVWLDGKWNGFVEVGKILAVVE